MHASLCLYGHTYTYHGACQKNNPFLLASLLQLRLFVFHNMLSSILGLLPRKHPFLSLPIDHPLHAKTTPKIAFYTFLGQVSFFGIHLISNLIETAHENQVACIFLRAFYLYFLYLTFESFVR